MAIDTNEKQMIIRGRPALVNFAIAAGLALGIPFTTWSMWQSGEVSIWFVIAYAAAFGTAAPFILNDLIKPVLRKAVFERYSKSVTIEMGKFFGSDTMQKKISDVESITLNIASHAPEKPGGRRYHNVVIKFKDGFELLASSHNQVAGVRREHEMIMAFFNACGHKVKSTETVTPFVKMVPSRT